MRFWLELKRIIRKPANLLLILMVPALLTIGGIIFFNGFGVSSIKLGVYNKDNSPFSRFTIKLVMSFFQGSTLTYVDENYQALLQNGSLNAILVIPENFTDGLYNGEQVNISFIPSPVDLQLSVGIYNVINSIFKDLSGSPFFNPQVLKYLFVGEGTPAPKIVPKTENFETTFGNLFSPAILFLSVVFLTLSIGVLSIINDRENGLIAIFKVNNEKWYWYALLKFLPLMVLGLLVSFIVYTIGYIFGIKIPLKIFLPLSLLCSIFHASLALILSSLSPTRTIANISSIALSMFFFFTSGSITPVSTLPSYIYKISTFTPIYKTIYAIRNYQLTNSPISAELKYISIVSIITLIGMLLIIKKEFSKK
ncbi:ABC transporter permease [Thermosipho ferrireducens]|uniref:ABC transporter permease n=1 Tax=Thermosipho ferrireducens TaxID=2571116 RepID=A0ABX7S892_9BACT|nr:ABC transporter permease [Thermosipho ferrireducens]QTA38817.1 ABC transporter permease [Thermosipho ferrireducens]